MQNKAPVDIVVWFDGACDNVRSKKMGVGVCARIMQNRQLIEHLVLAKNYGIGTSNVAEWIGCCHAMKMVNELSKKYTNSYFTVYSDSQIIANQFNGKYAIRKENFLFYYDVAKAFYKKSSFRGDVSWIPREFNKEADLYSKIGLLAPQQLFNLKCL